MVRRWRLRRSHLRRLRSHLMSSWVRRRGLSAGPQRLQPRRLEGRRARGRAAVARLEAPEGLRRRRLLPFGRCALHGTRQRRRVSRARTCVATAYWRRRCTATSRQSPKHPDVPDHGHRKAVLTLQRTSSQYAAAGAADGHGHAAAPDGDASLRLRGHPVRRRHQRRPRRNVRRVHGAAQQHGGSCCLHRLNRGLLHRV